MKDTTDVSFLRKAGLDFIDEAILESPLKSLGIFSTENLNEVQLQQVREAIQAHYRWDALAISELSASPGIKSYLIKRLSEGKSIEWNLWQVASAKQKEIMEWVSTQQRLALTRKGRF